MAPFTSKTSWRSRLPPTLAVPDPTPIDSYDTATVEDDGNEGSAPGSEEGVVLEEEEDVDAVPLIDHDREP
jgi:hypothetical protein